MRNEIRQSSNSKLKKKKMNITICCVICNYYRLSMCPTEIQPILLIKPSILYGTLFSVGTYNFSENIDERKSEFERVSSFWVI